MKQNKGIRYEKIFPESNDFEAVNTSLGKVWPYQKILF